MKIVADENIPLCEAFFGDIADIVRLPGRQMSAEHVRDADALLVRSVTKVNAGLLADSSVSFVGTCTIGMDHLDTRWLDSVGIAYTNAPGCNANSVVEYVYAALAALDVDWITKRFGIIGCGNVGGLLYRRLKAQGIECYCYDPFLTSEQNPDLATLEQVLSADVVCLHTPLTLDGPHPTRHLLGERDLLQLPSGTVLLNAGRGEVIDNAALNRVLQQRTDLQVVLDVWEPEPEISLELLDRVALGTPHIAGYSFDGKLMGTAMIYQALCQHFTITPRVQLAEVSPKVSDSLLTLPGGSDWHALQQLLPEVYAITDDDARLRALAASVRTEGASLAQGFDALRKHYPLRREFHNYRVRGDFAQKEPQAQRLAAIGFSI
ncbi:MAG TPA: 4-phosphoerythronate dehydrogenase, partial [Marinobacter sp.]|nr:4-phosphoerythronate dehydrogenase [Marinobacter sp.]